jgi:peptide/nickel transport system permease protein
MLVADIVLTIPGLPLVMVLAIIFEPTEPWAVGLLLTVNAWGGTARQIRSQVLATGRESYVEASGIMSLSLPTIMGKDILPNIAPFVFVRFVQQAREVIIASVALYFLGVLPFTNVNWGVMLNLAYKQGALYSFGTAHLIIVPIVPMVLLMYGLILFAQGTDRIFNPRVRARHAALADPNEEREDAPAVAAPGDD